MSASRDGVSELQASLGPELYCFHQGKMTQLAEAQQEGWLVRSVEAELGFNVTQGSWVSVQDKQ